MILLSFLMMNAITVAATEGSAEPSTLQTYCEKSLKDLPGPTDSKKLSAICLRAEQLTGCESQNGVPIFHVDHKTAKPKARNILAFALIHGDEKPAGTVARSWLERLQTVETRSNWRIVPILNPDGLKKSTRTNGRGVDLNRNFPTKNWEKDAVGYWTKHTKKDPRRFPGESSGSEKETQCAMKHIAEFQPDFVISVHTPLAVLDFDGPKVSTLPKFGKLPWKSLGRFPGSLGSYMWQDHSRPVATVELAGNQVLETFDQYEKLQDVLGTVATEVTVPAKLEKSKN